MSDNEDSDNFDYRNFQEISEEIKSYKKNPVTSGMFVSGWDDADENVDIVNNPKANPKDHILWAAENGETDTLKELISANPELVHVSDSDGYTPLHRAAYSNHLYAISYLLSVGAQVSAKTGLGWTPLHSACNWNNYSAAARLLAAGADLTALSDGGQTPLHITSAKSHCKSTLLILLLREEAAEVAKLSNNSDEIPEQLAHGHGIYAPLFEMVLPAASFIRNLSFTCNPYVRNSSNTLTRSLRQVKS